MEAVQAPHIVARLARDLDDSISRLFPEKIGAVHNSADTGYGRECAPAIENDWWTLESTQEGYLQTIDGEALVQLAESNDLIIRLEVRVWKYAQEISSLSVIQLRPYLPLQKVERTSVSESTRRLS